MNINNKYVYLDIITKGRFMGIKRKRLLRILHSVKLYTPAPRYSKAASLHLKQDLDRLTTLYRWLPGKKDKTKINYNGRETWELVIDSFKLTYDESHTNIIFSVYNTSEKKYVQLYSDYTGIPLGVNGNYLRTQLICLEQYIKCMEEQTFFKCPTRWLKSY
tara:strand:- start:49 stop:531 length:483 start_codon:yes stop_codon:yes gene_type:complete